MKRRPPARSMLLRLSRRLLRRQDAVGAPGHARTDPTVTPPASMLGGAWPDGFEPLGLLGSGGRATVHAARRQSDGAQVAIKIIDPPAGGAYDTAFDIDAERRVRLDAARRMRHPAVAATLDVQPAGPCLAVVMAHVPGRTLSDVLESGPLDADDAAAVALSVAGGLAAVHYAGLLHLDVKPDNIMHADRTSGGPAGVLLDVATSEPDGMPVTPAYTAPERVRGEVAGPAADVYALGLTLYEAVTGVATFRGQGDAVLHQQLVRTPPEPRQLTPGLPAAFNVLIMQMIDKDPTARPRLGEVQTALQALTQTRTVEASPLAEQVNVLLGGGRPQLTRLTLTPDGGRLRASFKPQDPGVRLDGAVSVAWTPPGRPAVAYRGAPHGPGGVVLQRSSSWRDAPPAQLEVRNPLQVRLAPGGGDAFVLDGDLKAVVRFKASGRPVGRIGPVPPGVGRLLKPVAFCRPQDGRTFVLDAGRNLVYAYAADGTFERAFGLQGAGDTQPREVAGMAVDDAGRLLLVDARTARLRTLTPSGTLEGSLPLPTELELTGAQVFLKPTRGLVLLGVRGAHEVWALRRDGAAPVRVPLPGMLQDLP